jgi:homoserine kinase type II
MSVYTKLSDPELDTFLSTYLVGQVLDFEGIEAGIENSNYFVTTDQGRFVLTIFEQASVGGLKYCLELMAFLSDRALPSPRPIADARGEYLTTLKSKPAALVERLGGASIDTPGLEQCRLVGKTLGAMHQATQSYPPTRENERGPDWHAVTAAQIRGYLNPADKSLLDREMAFNTSFDFNYCKRGVVHADLFRDNVLFDGPKLSGLIDFYYAHSGPLIYDLAVTVCDWCFGNAETVFDQACAKALVDAYSRTRVVDAIEIEAWLPSLRAAGLRFWLSRLKDQIFPRHGHLTHIKDPTPFKTVLQHCQRHSDQLQSVWS